MIKTMQGASDGKSNIDYFGIIKKSWQITRENKNLWWFGLLASLGGGINFSIPLDNGSFQANFAVKQEMQLGIAELMNQHFDWIVIGSIVVVGMIIIFSILKTFGRIGLISQADMVIKGEKSSIKNGLQEGKIFFWQIFFTDILLGVSIVGVAVVLFLPVGYLFYLRAFAAAFIALFLAIIIFIALMTLVAIMRAYIYIYIVLGRISISEAVENSYKIFSENNVPSILMLLVVLLVGILFGVIMFCMIIAFVIFFALLAVVLSLIFGKMGILISVILGLLTAIPVLFLIRSAQETLCQTAWIFFLKKITEIEEVEKIQETDQENISEKVPGTEAV